MKLDIPGPKDAGSGTAIVAPPGPIMIALASRGLSNNAPPMPQANKAAVN
ncbi:hypothetical protein WJ978_07430 [Achromobacter xylosoxidans]